MTQLVESCSFYERVNYTPTLTEKNMLFYYDWAGHYVCNKDFFVDRANYKTYLILYTAAGSGKLLYENGSYVLSKNSVIFIDCNKHHTYYPLDDDWEFYYIHISGSNLSDLYSQYKDKGIMLQNCPASVPKYISGLIEMNSKTLNFDYSVSDRIYRILCALLNASSGLLDDNIPSDILNAIQFMNDNIECSLNISDISQQFNYSRIYFSKRFKRYIGIGPKEYLLNRKISVSKELLLSGEYSVDEIASKCGFSCASAFIRTFKSISGMTPLNYKNSFVGNGFLKENKN